MKLFISFIALVMLVQISVAEARCTRPSPGSELEKDGDDRLVNSAFFIGMMHIDNIDIRQNEGSIYNPGYVITASPIQPYIGSLDHQITFEMEHGVERVHPGKKGQIFERVIFKDENDRYSTTGQCISLSENRLFLLREKAEKTDEYIKLENDCAAQGGKLSIVDRNEGIGDHALYCLYPASDNGEPCIDSIQCEGLCIAELIDEEERKVREQFFHEKHKGPLPWAALLVKEGVCSSWKNEKGCYYMVQGGRVRSQTCSHDF